MDSGTPGTGVRSFLQDVLYPHREKDYRCLMACPLRDLRGVTLQVHRVGRDGHLYVDHLMGVEPGAEETVIPLLIWNGHMRLLDSRVGGEVTAAALGRRWSQHGKLARNLVAEGWKTLLLETGRGVSPAAPAFLPWPTPTQ